VPPSPDPVCGWIQTSRSTSVVKIPAIGFGWLGTITAFGLHAVARNHWAEQARPRSLVLGLIQCFEQGVQKRAGMVIIRIVVRHRASAWTEHAADNFRSSRLNAR
jgi:hypothetical protein